MPRNPSASGSSDYLLRVRRANLQLPHRSWSKQEIHADHVLVCMTRKLRRYRCNKLYEVTHKTAQALYFFVPGPRLNAIVVGAMAYAAEKYDIQFCWTTWMTNHAHHLVRANGRDDDECAWKMKMFWALACSQISKEVQNICRGHGVSWSGGIFGERASVVEVTDEPQAQLARMRHAMEQGVKEGLCPDPCAWPGVQSAKAWVDESMELHGIWVDRSGLYDLERTHRRRKLKIVRPWMTKKERKRFDHRVTLKLHPLPCMDEMSSEQRRRIARDMRQDILVEHAERIGRLGRGWRKRLMDPILFGFRPRSTKKDIVPMVHSASEEVWRCWIDDWESWYSRFDNASRRLRAGIAEALGEFPQGGFVPTGWCRHVRAGPVAVVPG